MRVQWRCSLPDFDEDWWGDDLQQGPFMGRHPEVRNGELAESKLALFEDHRDGCPGGWYRCGFVLSTFRYLRNYSQAGFGENLQLTRCHDPLVLEAVSYYEHELLRAQDDYIEVTKIRRSP